MLLRIAVLRPSKRTWRTGGLLLGTAFIVTTLASCGGASPGPMSMPEGDGPSRAAEQAYFCLKDQGWDVELTDDGAVEASSESIPEAQYDQYRAASDACWAAIDDKIRAMTPDQIRRAYVQELDTRDCLVELGYDVGQPVSEQTFLDEFFTAPWSAYGAAGFAGRHVPSDEWRAANDACPQPAGSWGLD